VSAVAAGVGSLEQRVRALRREGAAVDPDRAEPILNDGYAHVLDLEAKRARLRRLITELAADAHELDAAEQLRKHSLELRSVERELARVRELLAELEELAGGPVVPDR
jgi:hypothetical protein